jgi:hypothetical protein
MRTTIVVKSGGNYLRTCRWTDMPPEGEARPRRASFRAEHRSKCRSFDPKTLKGREVERTFPDMVIFGARAFDFTRGRINDLRVIPEEYVAELDSIDRQIAELQRHRNELAEAAYDRGKPVTLEQAREWFSAPKAQ